MSKNLEPLLEPENYELQFCLSLEYGLVIEHAGDKLSLLLVSCIKAIETARGWYVGTCDARPDVMLSDALNPHENRACSRFDRFIASVKRYPPGRLPVERIVNCIRVARFFCQEAESLIHDISVVNLRDAVNELVEFLSDKTMVGWEFAKYEQALDKLAEKVKTALVGLRDAFYAFEATKANPPSMPCDGAKALERIERAVLRVDARDRRAKRDERRRFSVETQNRVHGIWEMAQANAILRQGSSTRVTKRQAFDYYRDDLRSQGVTVYEDFLACLGARSDRLARSRKQQLK